MQQRDRRSHEGGDDPRLVVADVLSLKRGARADLALEAGAAVNDGVVAEEGEGDEDGGEGEDAGAAESRHGDKGLDTDRSNREDAVDLRVGGFVLSAGNADGGLEIAE